MSRRRDDRDPWARRVLVGAVAAAGIAGLAMAGHATAQAQAPSPDVLRAGRATFEARCATCHGANANGGEMGPPIATRLPSHDDTDLARLIHDGRPTRGMPPTGVPDAEVPALIAYLRTLQRQPGEGPPPRTFHTVDGRTFDARVLGEGFTDLQVRTADGRLHLLRRAPDDRVREVTSQQDWPTYNGGVGGNRYTTLAEIDRRTVSGLRLKWMFPAGFSRSRPSSSRA
jgi:mono/diheme cytochrome c family protein